MHSGLPDYLQAHRHTTKEAVRAGRTFDPAELHRRAVELFVDAHHETAAAHHDRDESRELDKLRQHLPTGDAAEGYDTAAARKRRAYAVRAHSYDADTTASALLHDL